MYNRYIPQPDGSYRRSRIPDPPRPKSQPPAQTPPQEPPEQETCHRKDCPNCRRNMPPKRERPKQDTVTSFLKNLLPKDFDTGDLLVVILLLLMSNDCAEDQNTALLTLMLYFFM